MPANPEKLTKITKIKENFKSAGLLVTQKLEEGVDTINAQNTIAGATLTEGIIFTAAAAAALLIDLKREKKQLKKAEQQALTERVFWGSLERESAKADEPRTREAYREKIQPIPPHTEKKFRYINPEDTEKAKNLMKQTLETIKDHPNTTNIDSVCYLINVSSHNRAHIALEIRPSGKDKQTHKLSYLELNDPHDATKPQSIDQRITWHDDGEALTAFEITKWPDGKLTKNYALSIEELTELQQKILSPLKDSGL